MGESEGVMSNLNTPYDDAFRTLLTDCPHLWFLLPFYFFNYSPKVLDQDQSLIAKMQETYEDIFERLNRLAAEKVISEYDRLAIKAMCENVALALTKRYRKVKEGVEQIMGGQVLEYEAKTIYQEGISQGQKLERQNTERERQRADIAERELEHLKRELEHLKSGK